MPLIILTGYPCSGLTYRAQQLAAGLEEAQSQLFSDTNTTSESQTTSSTSSKPKNRYKIHHVQTHDNGNYPRTVYDTARTEKEARGIAYTRAKRMLAKDSFVILDGMNYIKGYRYQLWCEAKALGTTCCVVHVGTPIDQCVANNEARIKRKEASPQSTEPATQADADAPSNPDAQSAAESPSPFPEAKETESDPYPPELLQNLIFRYEEPSMNSRWDKPLFTVPYTDAQPPIADIWTALTGLPHPSAQQAEAEDANGVSGLTSSLNSTTLSSGASTTTAAPGRSTLSTRPRVAIKPHQATVKPATADSSALYNMEKRTSAIIQAIRSFTLSNPSAKAALAASKHAQTQRHLARDTSIDSESTERMEEGIYIPVPESTQQVFIPSHIASASVTDDLGAAGGILALPRLQRLRRQWITLNRAYIAAPHAAGKGGGGLKDAEIGDAFVRFLNADFGDEGEEQ
ncbi:chromatin associated protein KTI12 [Aspergillus unguis]